MQPNPKLTLKLLQFYKNDEIVFLNQFSQDEIIFQNELLLNDGLIKLYEGKIRILEDGRPSHQNYVLTPVGSKILKEMVNLGK